MAIIVVSTLAWVFMAIRHRQGQAEPAWMGNVKFLCVLAIIILAIRLGDFETILGVGALLTGILWLIDKTVYPAKRDKDGNKVKPKRSAVIDIGASFFGVILVVLILRSFVFEPFRIPSESMVPTLQNGDFVVVSKFSYGLRLPITNTKILDTGSPERGDVAVFRKPGEEHIDYIKRIIGLPGDTVEYKRGRLILNGQPVPIENAERYQAEAVDSCGIMHTELLPDHPHAILTKMGFSKDGQCFDQGRTPSSAAALLIPDGHYWVMGDNRQNSRDSREWGLVPEGHLVGKATYIWFNFRTPDQKRPESEWGTQWGRMGTKIQ